MRGNGVFVVSETNLVSFQALDTPLVSLLTQNDEGTTIFVVCHVHLVEQRRRCGLGMIRHLDVNENQQITLRENL